MRILAAPLLYAVILATSACSAEQPIVEWKDGIVPYYLTGNFSDADVADIRRAMARWEGVCGVLFFEVMPRSDAYMIKRITSNEWTSSIGENNIQNAMLFDGATPRYGHILHELGHCIGLLHEHQRPDRDKYLTVVWDNIWPEARVNFDTRDNPLYEEESLDYDYGSILHYFENAYSINGAPTIIPREAIHRGEDLSTLDGRKCALIYGEPKNRSDYEDDYE